MLKPNSQCAQEYHTQCRPSEGFSPPASKKLITSGVSASANLASRAGTKKVAVRLCIRTLMQTLQNLIQVEACGTNLAGFSAYQNPRKQFVPQKQPKRKLPEPNSHGAADGSVVRDPQAQK